ncbi:MAG: hypothetical protein JWN17_1904 [Frankiales bacterium]|nr:hypothetical protein [Frankiales bacterium]
MSGNPGANVSIDVTPDEATLIIAALRQFEPFWPSDMDALTHAELLAGIRSAVDGVTARLSS